MKSRTALLLLVSAGLALPQLSPSASVTFTNLTGAGRVRGINRGNLIVGYTVGGDHVRGFTLQNGATETIAAPDSIQTFVYGVENNGRVVGAYYKADSSGAHGFLYFHGAVTTIDVPGAAATIARGINDPQRIVGEFKDNNGRSHGFFYDGGSFTTIDMPGAIATRLEGLNNPGDIVGHYTDAKGAEHGFMQDRKGVKTTIDVPFAGATDTFLYGINSSGVIVGSYIDDTGTHGFADVNGAFLSIDAPETPPGVGTFVQGINDNGQLVIFGTSAFLGNLGS
jgi:probable HAF family extracellular repeat protein